MEITGIYQAQKDLIEDLKRANELLKKEKNELQKDKDRLYSTWIDEEEVKQEYTPAVIELTRQQIYHLMDFVEGNGTVDSVVLKASTESGIGPTITVKATVEIDLTDHSTW